MSSRGQEVSKKSALILPPPHPPTHTRGRDLEEDSPPQGQDGSVARDDLGLHTLAPQALSPDLGQQGPVETDYYPGHNTAAPVQETLHGCQPVAQEDGKESRISVQERQLTGSVDLKQLV